MPFPRPMIFFFALAAFAFAACFSNPVSVRVPTPQRVPIPSIAPSSSAPPGDTSAGAPIPTPRSANPERALVSRSDPRCPSVLSRRLFGWSRHERISATSASDCADKCYNVLKDDDLLRFVHWNALSDQGPCACFIFSPESDSPLVGNGKLDSCGQIGATSKSGSKFLVPRFVVDVYVDPQAVYVGDKGPQLFGKVDDFEEDFVQRTAGSDGFYNIWTGSRATGNASDSFLSKVSVRYNDSNPRVSCSTYGCFGTGRDSQNAGNVTAKIRWHTQHSQSLMQDKDTRRQLYRTASTTLRKTMERTSNVTGRVINGYCKKCGKFCRRGYCASKTRFEITSTPNSHDAPGSIAIYLYENTAEGYPREQFHMVVDVSSRVTWRHRNPNIHPLCDTANAFALTGFIGFIPVIGPLFSVGSLSFTYACAASPILAAQKVASALKAAS